ncbi:hypothetical protein Aduo_016411 [Ancylostoma duodenale]
MLVVVGLLVIACSAIASIYQIPLVKIESEMVHMLRQKTWGAHLKRMELQRLRQQENFAVKEIYNQPVYEYYGVEYVVNVTVGTPDQTFQVALDTASADFWIIDDTCAPDYPEVCDKSMCDTGCKFWCAYMYNCAFLSVYISSKESSSYTKTHGKWKFRYDNATVEGFYGNDTMRFGNDGISQLIVPGTIFGQAIKLHDHFVGRHIDGILGMGFSSLAEGRGEPPFERAVKLGLVHPIFTIYLKHAGRAGNVYGGEITYGGRDMQHCDHLIVYHNITLATYWQFKIHNFTSGDFSATSVLWVAMSDTVSPFIGAPVAIAEAIAKQFDANYNAEDDKYYINCNAKPTFVFGIGLDKYTIDPSRQN